MKRTADVVVVGGGCIGTSIAYHLARRGVGRVLLIEKNQVASGATGRSSALVRQHYGFPILARMAKKSLEVFRNFGEVVGGDAGFVETGYSVLVGPDDVDQLSANVQILQGVGVQTRLLSPAELKALVPQVEIRDIGAATYEPESGYADPHVTTMAFATRAKELGAEIVQGTAVRGVREVGGRVTGVTTDAGDVDAGTVSLAANAWTPALARTVGVEIPLQCIRHEVSILVRPADFGPGHPAMADFVLMVYMRSEGSDMTLIGDIAHDPSGIVDPDRCPDRARPETLTRFAELATGRFPALATAGHKRAYAAFYDVSPDSQFILDRLPGIEGGYVACGFSGHGFKHCPVVGELVADLVLDGRTRDPDLDLAFFRLDRFGGGAPGHTPPYRFSRPRFSRGA